MKTKPKFVTKIFAAIEGYNEIKAQSEQHAQGISRTAREIVKPLVEHNNGVWMYERDGKIYSNFAKPEDAVDSAVAIQQALAGEPDLKLRIGIHTGDAKSGIGTGDIVASGIAEIAAPGGVCISDKVYASIQNKTDVTAEYIEDVKPAGVDHAVRVYALAGEGLNEPVITSSVKEPSTKKPQPSIVVLPFDDISPGKDNEYFSDGLTEEIITDLSHVHELRVISRTSAMRLKGTQKDMNTISRDLNVQYVLEGSVRKVGNNLRITAQLIDAVNDQHLWAEKYSGTLDDIFDIQEKVSRTIVDALKLKLNPKESKIISTKPIENFKAYECYLKARHEYWRFTEDALERSLKLLQNGFEIVGENELLYAAKGTIYWQYVNAMLKPGKSYDNYLKEADECAKKVFELNPNSSVGHVLRGVIYQNSGNPKEAIRHFKRAVEIDSNNSEALMLLGYQYAASGKETVGRGFIEKSAELDPLTPISQGVPGWIDTFEGNFSAAVEDWYKMYQMDSENPLNRWIYAWSLAMDNRIEDALAMLDSIEINASQMNPWENLCLFQKYSLRGQNEDALQSVTSELTEASKWDDGYSLFMAECYSCINEPDLAIDWLENTIHYGIINYPFLNEYDPFLENIRGEERFKKLMERVKHDWENFEV